MHGTIENVPNATLHSKKAHTMTRFSIILIL